MSDVSTHFNDSKEHWNMEMFFEFYQKLYNIFLAKLITN